MISYFTTYIYLYILGMITYHAQYRSLYIIITITYHIFGVRIIFLDRGFHSNHNCPIYHNILALYKTGYKNQNPNSDCLLL